MAVVRWTDEMLDELASSIVDLRDSANTLRDSVNTLRDSDNATRDSVNTLRDSLETTQEGLETLRDNVDSLRITAQALLQVAAQHEREMESIRQRQAETDQRFNILLEEVRYLRRGNQE